MANRQQAILSLIRQNGKVWVEDLVETFGTTPQTIRKDLRALEDDRKVLRFHGGATLFTGVEYMAYDTRRHIASVQKAQIGQAVANLIPNHTALFINGGTTTEAVAGALKDHVGLKIILDNVNISNALRQIGGVEVVIAGGIVRSSDGAVIGSTAVDFIRQFRTDYAVIGAAGVSSDGALLDFDLREAQIVRAIIENARHVILAVDSTKFEATAPVVMGRMEQIDTLVTDRCPVPALRAFCREHDIALIETDADKSLRNA